MNDITNNFGTLYYPKNALVFYQCKGKMGEPYVEYFDMDINGTPINAHPLTVREASHLAKALKTEAEKRETFLKPTGILDGSILYTDQQKGEVIWFTKTQQRKLYFTKKLGIANGTAHIPPMLWAAERNRLSVFALNSNKRPTQNTRLYNAPFFNVYEDGDVCMGTVDVRIRQTASLEEFTGTWESYFFDSYFSHLMQDYNPIDGNCVLLWEGLVNKDEAFPMDVLKYANRTFKDLIR